MRMPWVAGGGMKRKVGGKTAIAAIAVVFVAATLSLGFVTGTGDFWHLLRGDVADAQIGWFYYARDVWHFPVFYVGNYHQPEGSYVTLSDSLPLLALAFKALYKLFYAQGSDPPIYAGIWCAFCFFLQVIAASRLLLSLGVRQPLQHFAALVLFCYVPILFFRFGQFGLLGHFFILLSLDGYVRATRTPCLPLNWWLICSGPVVALMLHPYIAAMSAIFFLATVIECVRNKTIDAKGLLLRLAGTGGSAICLMLLGGGYLTAAAQNFADYGIYSLNLASPFVPFPNTLLGRILVTNTPSIPGIYQWEGGCYLGAGMLGLCLACVPFARDFGARVRKHRVLVALLLPTIAFAISNRIGFGSRELFTIPLPEKLVGILSTFRGSGRFVWVGVYTLTAFLVTSVVRGYSRRASIAVLVGAASLQFVDIAPMQRDVRAATQQSPQPTINVAAWSELLAKHSKVFEFPSFECGGIYDADVAGGRWRALEIDWLVAKAGLPNNSAYLTRYTKNCDRERSLAMADHERGTLYLYRSTEDIGAFLSTMGAVSAACGYLDDVVICSPDMDLSSLK
jgi:hypothetical protein